MAQITGLREVRGQIIIDLDGVRWLSVRKKHFRQCPLELQDAIDPDAYLDRIAAVQSADAYEAALTMLDTAAQTRAGVVKKLILKGYAAPAAEAAAERLEAAGLIDDRRYAERLAQSQLNKPVGAFAVRRKLRGKNLSEADIEAVMDSFDGVQQSAACFDAAQSLYKKYAALPPREARAKLSQALARRGFSWDAISQALDLVASPADDEW